MEQSFGISVSNPYYFIRKGILSALQANAHHLKGDLMDFGCGSKPYQSLFQYNSYTGVDFENPGHSHENEQIDVYYDGHHIPLPDNSIDGVLASEVFEHVFNLPEILLELRRVMKPGARLLATCPFVWKEHELPHDFARYTLYALDDLLKKAGFEKVHAEKTGNFLHVLIQLTILYGYDKLYGKACRFSFTKSLYTLLGIILPNRIGQFLGKFMGRSKQMYLNNVIVYQKKL